MTAPKRESELLLPSRKGLLRSAVVMLMVLTHISAFMLGYYLMPAKTPAVVQANYSEEQFLSRATRRLGRQSVDFGLSAQAQALLRFMVEQPDRKVYQLFFTNGLMRFELKANLSSQVLTRVQTQPDGSGKVERWKGKVLERLQQATAGGDMALEGEEKPAFTVSFFQPSLQRTPP